MFEAPEGFEVVKTDVKKELKHTFTINQDGQVVFNRQFFESELLSKKESTFVTLLWNSDEKQLMFGFASEKELKDHDPGFDKSSLSNDMFEIKKGDTQKGLKVALRDRCSPRLIPPEDYDYYYEEGSDLTHNEEGRYITLETSGKRPRPNKDKQKELDTIKQNKKKQAKKQATFQDMAKAYHEDPAGYMAQILDNEWEWDEETTLKFLKADEKIRQHMNEIKNG